jgi:predicted RNase H-like HicB family nuclease
MPQVVVPAGFLRAGETPADLYDAASLAVDFGWIDGYRVVYQQLPRNWTAYSPDLDGVISTGATREDVERNLREAIPFHLEGLARDRAERPWLYAEASQP